MMRLLAACAALSLLAGNALAQGAVQTPEQGRPLQPALVAYDVREIEGLPGIPKPLTDKAGSAREGAKVFVNRRLGNCLGCHEVTALKREEFHGELGPVLDGVGSRWDAARLRMIVVDPKKVFADTVMPAFYRTDGLHRVRPEFKDKPILTAQQVEDVVAFLSSLK
jgi:L-cysteine S-thiosulfotransferase